MPGAKRMIGGWPQEPATRHSVVGRHDRGAAPPVPLTWRILRDPPLAGARNMALDHALAACLGEGEAVLRLYGWSRPTVSFGRNEPARAMYAGSPDALDFVRRPTGGRAVVHARELTYAVVAPLHAWGGLRAAYAAINEALGAALRRLGAPVELARAWPAAAPTASGTAGTLATTATVAPAAAAASGGAGAVLPLDAGPCFQSPAPGEVVAAGRKLVGSAQARLEGALLQHGSILLDDDQGLLEALGEVGRPASLRELVGDVSIDDVMETVAMSLPETFGGRWVAEGWRSAETAAADRLEAERYALDSWTWRR